MRVSGLLANLGGFGRLAERLAYDTLRLVAIDLRGRGRIEVTGPNTVASPVIRDFRPFPGQGFRP